VHVLYPKGKVSPIQECQFTTLGRNITALEVDGNFDDCQALVKNAFMDVDVNSQLRLTSANSINVARLLPQSFYYFHGYAQMKRLGLANQLVVCVPSGNFGNICAALFAKRMGLPVKRFVAANNANQVFFDYLQSGKYDPRPSIPTLANAMDVGDPSNAARIFELYGHDWKAITDDISGNICSDDQIRQTLKYCREKYGLSFKDIDALDPTNDIEWDIKSGRVIFYLTHDAKHKEEAYFILFKKNFDAFTGKTGFNYVSL
jgi:threonine synthase